MSPATLPSGTWEVTRAFHTSSRTLNSEPGASVPMARWTKPISSTYELSASRIACLLKGVKHTASAPPAAAIRRTVRKLRTVTAPPAALDWPSVMASVSAWARSRKAAWSNVAASKSGRSRVVPAKRSPSAQSRRSPTTSQSAASKVSLSVSAFRASSLPMPDGSPSARAIRGRSAMDVVLVFCCGRCGAAASVQALG